MHAGDAEELSKQISRVSEGRERQPRTSKEHSSSSAAEAGSTELITSGRSRRIVVGFLYRMM